jgi:hypothetical protein
MQFPFHVGNVDTTKIPDGLGTVNVSLDTIMPMLFTPGPCLIVPSTSTPPDPSAVDLSCQQALPLLGFWLPFFFMCGALDILTDSAPGSVWPGGNPGKAVSAWYPYLPL